MDATDGSLLLHVPPVVALLKVVIDSLQTVATPVIVAGNGFTVTTIVLRQPLGSV
jgi:hypothetical protein